MTSIPSETCRLRLVKHMLQPHTSFISYGRPIRAKVGLNRTGDMSATPQTPMLHRVINPVKCQCFPMMTALRGDVPNLLLPQQGAPQVDGKTSASMIFHAAETVHQYGSGQNLVKHTAGTRKQWKDPTFDGRSLIKTGNSTILASKEAKASSET